MGGNNPAGGRSVAEVTRYLVHILQPERSYYLLALVYGVGIGVLSLAVPISVQVLINTIANTAMLPPLVVLSTTLFVLLLLAGLLNALRIHLMEKFARRFYSRMVSEIALRAIYAVDPFFQDARKAPLFNRYFDIINVTKAVPNLLVGGFTVLLQAVIGLVLVSMYHPLFLVFSLTVLGLFWSAWLIWGRRAIRSSFRLSHDKHEAAAWLQGLAASNGYYKSPRHIDAALTRTDAVTGQYIESRSEHFRDHFSQTLSFMLLYALASAALLGLGGWLVIEGQLSLGQLVAAELVLSAVLYSLSQLGLYLNYLYDLYAAIDELALFYDLEQEKPRPDAEQLGQDARLAFVAVRDSLRGQDAEINVNIPSRARVLARADSHGLQRLFIHLLRRSRKPSSGYITVGDVDIATVNLNTLRESVMVLNRPITAEMTIRELLRLSSQNPTAPRLQAAIRAVGLDETIAQLEDGLDTRLASTGYPLSIAEMMSLKLAVAILAEPKVVILNPLYDNMPASLLREALDLLQQAECTVVHFSNRESEAGYSHYLHLSHHQQRLFDGLNDFLGALQHPSREPARVGDVKGA